MLKALVSLALCLIIVFFYVDEKNRIFPVFQLTNTPTIITKGQFGVSLIIEVSYSHDGFDGWLLTLPKRAPLFLVDADWLLRSPETVQLLIDQNVPVGLLGATQDAYEADEQLLERQLTIFKKYFQTLPLWFAAKDSLIHESVQQTLHAYGVNLIAANRSYNGSERPFENGDFIRVPLHRENSISFLVLQQYIEGNPFISIEENLFGEEIYTKRIP